MTFTILYLSLDSGSDPDGAFFTALGGKGPIKSADEGGDDDEYEKQAQTEIALYRWVFRTELIQPYPLEVTSLWFGQYWVNNDFTKKKN